MVPDVGSIQLPGAKAELGARHKRGDGNLEGVRGLKALGVRDLNYRVAFLACSVTPTNPKVNAKHLIKFFEYFFHANIILVWRRRNVRGN